MIDATAISEPHHLLFCLFVYSQVNTTDPPHVQFIRKPIYSAMALLSYVGDEQIRVEHMHC